MTKQRGPSKQRCIRFEDELRAKVEDLAEQEGRTFSAQVVWMLRSAMAQRAFSRPSDHQHQQPAVAA
jgi:hypothetical protein